MEEIWKDVPEYEGLYEVSSLGRVRSLARQWTAGNCASLKHNGKVLSAGIGSDGYRIVVLCNNKHRKTMKVHKLVAMAFLQHKPNNYEFVIDHINDIKSDNRVENLQLVTQRFNAFKTQGNYSSQYKGVCWNKYRQKWTSHIRINKLLKYLGAYNNEYDAHLAYQNALKNLEQ